MPSTPIYIRQADYERWLLIPDKAQFISDAINQRATPAPTPGGFSEVPSLSPEIEPTYAVIVKDTGVIVGKKMSRLGAENFLQKSNIDGDMIVVQE